VTGPLDPDPFDFDALRENLPLSGAEHELTTVPVRKPGKEAFFRVHPGDDFTVASYVLEHTEGLDREIYWLPPQLQRVLAESDSGLGLPLTLVRLFTCITRQNTVLLWPCKLPSADGRLNTWTSSALTVAEVAKTRWVRMFANMGTGAYDYAKARADLGEPQWPDRTFKDLVQIAFAGRIIATTEHPVVRQLLGDL
jgi:hypothetical protein